MPPPVSKRKLSPQDNISEDENTRLRDENARLSDENARLKQERVEDIEENARLRDQVDKLLNILKDYCQQKLSDEK